MELDMKQSLIITIGIFSIIGTSLFGYGLYENNKQIHKNYILAQDKFRNGDLKGAENLLEKKPPKDIAKDYYELKYNVELNLYKISAAEETIKKLLKICPEDAFFNYLASLAYYNDGDNTNTEKYLKLAVKYAPDIAEYKMRLGNFYSNIGKEDEAIELYKEVIEQNSEYEVAWDAIATIYENKKDLNHALEYRKDAVKNFPNNTYDLYMLAELYKQMGNKQLAAKFYAKTAELDIGKDTDAESKYFSMTGKMFKQTGSHNTISIPYEFKNGLMVVKASVNGHVGNFLVDTGANSSVIYSTFADKYAIKQHKNRRGLMKVANGQENVVPMGIVTIKISQFIFENTEIALVNYKHPYFDGIIGNDVLSKTNFYIDKNNKNIVMVK